jgi:zinc transporter ZupT
MESILLESLMWYKILQAFTAGVMLQLPLLTSYITPEITYASFDNAKSIIVI